mgnify:CR=1 FL=1
MIGLRTLPCISAKENENRQNLQAPDQHTQGEHQLGEAGKGGVVAHGAHQLQSGAHITDAETTAVKVVPKEKLSTDTSSVAPRAMKR